MTFPSPPGFVGALLGLDGSWEDRLQEAAFTSPSGARVVFLYEDVERTIPLRSAPFEFSRVNNSYVQQNGYGSRQYQIKCIFTGDNHDLEAGAFEKALLEEGIGKLEHPLYGTFDAVPFGPIKRRDPLVTQSNQSLVEVTFWTTVRAIYPNFSSSPTDEILGALTAFDLSIADSFESAMDLADEANRATSIGTIRGFLGDISASLDSVSASVASVRRKFTELQDVVNTGIDVLIGQPLDLARQISDLIKAPGLALDGIISRLEGYRDLAERIFGSPAGNAGTTSQGSSLPGAKARASNDVTIADLVAMNAVAGSVVSVVNTSFETRTQALKAAEEVLEQYDQIIEWRDGQLTALGQNDDGGAHQALQKAVALTAGYLVETSFSLTPERSIIIDRARTVIDLAAELYGKVDDATLDLLIGSNDLTGSEIVELPKLKEIVYYA